MANVGRRSKLTPEVQSKIVSAIRAGNYAHIAASLAGINRSTYYRWLELGEGSAAKQPYKEFRDTVKEAEASAEVANVALIRQAAQNGTWQAAAWYLERKHSDRWGRNDKVRQEISGPEGKPIQVADPREVLLTMLEKESPVPE
jgi:hypothetical protein